MCALVEQHAAGMLHSDGFESMRQNKKKIAIPRSGGKRTIYDSIK